MLENKAYELVLGSVGLNGDQSLMPMISTRLIFIKIFKPKSAKPRPSYPAAAQIHNRQLAARLQPTTRLYPRIIDFGENASIVANLRF